MLVLVHVGTCTCLMILKLQTEHRCVNVLISMCKVRVAYACVFWNHIFFLNICNIVTTDDCWKAYIEIFSFNFAQKMLLGTIGANFECSPNTSVTCLSIWTSSISLDAILKKVYKIQCFPQTKMTNLMWRIEICTIFIVYLEDKWINK